MFIFISYRRYDWPFAHRLHEQLQTRLGGEVYIDRKITSDNYETELLSKVTQCSILILIVTENTFRADRITQHEDWVRREVSLALRLGKPIVLVLYEGFRPPPAEQLPEDIRQVTRHQGVEFYPEFFEQAVDKLASQCAGLLPPGTIQHIAPASRRPQPTRERRLEAAMPAETAAGAASEVRVKVSLPDSKGLRGELPARLKSGDEIKKSDTRQTTFPMTFPVDETGRLLPATLCVEVTSEQFEVGFATYPESPCGYQRAEIDLLPDFDSRTVNFTLTARFEIPLFGRAIVMVRVFYHKQLIAELRLATTIVPRVEELQYVLDASPLLVGAPTIGGGHAATSVTAAAPSPSPSMAPRQSTPGQPGGFSQPDDPWQLGGSAQAPIPEQRDRRPRSRGRYVGAAVGAAAATVTAAVLGIAMTTQTGSMSSAPTMTSIPRTAVTAAPSGPTVRAESATAVAPDTGARLTVTIAPQGRGSDIYALVSDIPAGIAVRLVVVGRDGARHQIDEWVTSGTSSARQATTTLTTDEIAAMAIEDQSGRIYVAATLE